MENRERFKQTTSLHVPKKKVQNKTKVVDLELNMYTIVIILIVIQLFEASTVGGPWNQRTARRPRTLFASQTAAGLRLECGNTRHGRAVTKLETDNDHQ